MNNKKIEDYIRAAKPGDSANREHQQELRRELLNSQSFSRNPFKHLLFSYEFTAALSVAAIILIVIYFNVNLNNGLSSSEILSNINATYAGFLVPGQVNKFSSDVNLYTKENPVPFSAVNLQDYSQNDLYTEVGDAYTKDTLYKLLQNDGIKYISANPGIKFFNMRHHGSRIKTAHSGRIPENLQDTIRVSVVDSNRKITIDFPENAFMLINRNSIVNPELNSILQKKEYVKVYPETDFEEYISCTPLKLLDELNTCDSIQVYAEESDSTGNTMLVLKLASKMTQMEFKTLIINLSSDTSKPSRAFLKKLSTDNDSSMLTWLSQIKDTTRVLPDSFKIDLPQKVKLIKVNESDYSIQGAEFSVVKNGSTLKLADVNFNDHSIIESRPGLFDPSGLGLIEKPEQAVNLSD